MQALLLRNLRKMSAVTDDKDGNKMGKYNFDKVIDRRGAFAEKGESSFTKKAKEKERV